MSSPSRPTGGAEALHHPAGEPPSPLDDVERWQAAGVNVTIDPPGQNWGGLLLTLLPILLMVGFLWYLMRGMRSGGDGAVSFGKSRARMITEENSSTLFKDVAGVEEAKNDLYEVVEFLKNPSKFHALGARIPHGVLMVGPPRLGQDALSQGGGGRGAGALFQHLGLGLCRDVRGRGRGAPCATFSSRPKRTRPASCLSTRSTRSAGRRGMNINGGNDEREQTLNALLVEMDGFESKHDIIIVAATNRPDVLDPRAS